MKIYIKDFRAEIILKIKLLKIYNAKYYNQQGTKYINHMINKLYCNYKISFKIK